MLLQPSSLLFHCHLIIAILRVATNPTPDRLSTNGLPNKANKPTTNTNLWQCLAAATASMSTRALPAALPAHLAALQLPALAPVPLALTVNTVPVCSLSRLILLGTTYWQNLQQQAILPKWLDLAQTLLSSITNATMTPARRLLPIGPNEMSLRQRHNIIFAHRRHHSPSSSLARAHWDTTTHFWSTHFLQLLLPLTLPAFRALTYPSLGSSTNPFTQTTTTRRFGTLIGGNVIFILSCLDNSEGMAPRRKHGGTETGNRYDLSSGVKDLSEGWVAASTALFWNENAKKKNPFHLLLFLEMSILLIACETKQKHTFSYSETLLLVNKL